jgi:transcriptional regulator with XRE-family HTH domain
MAPSDEVKRRRLEGTRSPSAIFGRRLQERRRDLGWSQTELAEAMTREGFEMGKTAILRIEGGVRELKLDEAIAFAEVLNVPLAHLLEPAPDGMVLLTSNRATDGDGVQRWLSTGSCLGGLVWPAQIRTRHDRELAAAYLRDIAWDMVNAATLEDTARLKDARRRFSEGIERVKKQSEGAEQQWAEAMKAIKKYEEDKRG